MTKFIVTLLNIVAITNVVGVLYFALPGYPHILAAFGPVTGWQPTNSAICLVLLLVCAMLSGGMTLKSKCPHCQAAHERESRFCGQCGLPVAISGRATVQGRRGSVRSIVQQQQQRNEG